MSGLMRYNYHFLNLLLETEPRQQRALLANLTDSQVDAITEIFFNIAHVVDLSDHQQKRLKRRLKLVKTLSKAKQSRKYRRANIKRQAASVLSTLALVRDDVYKLIERAGQDG